MEDIITFVDQSFAYLQTARPTAVNISEAALRFSRQAEELSKTNSDPRDFVTVLYENLAAMLDDDIATNRQIGRHGAEHILSNHSPSLDQQVVILTHCNTGSLASAGYGTALGVIRRLNEQEKLKHAYCTETRPYNQGSRLTAYELLSDSIPSTLICDSMCGCLMKERRVTAVVVGADRVVANGDTANKIGTYQLAVLALYHKVPFYIAAPFTTVDFQKSCGSEIVIEERSQEEMTHFGGKRIAPAGMKCWNPAFDVTPAELITGGIITERGVFEPKDLLSQKLES